MSLGSSKGPSHMSSQLVFTKTLNKYKADFFMLGENRLSEWAFYLPHVNIEYTDGYSGLVDPTLGRLFLWKTITTTKMASTAPKLQVLRTLIKELRGSLQEHEKVRHSPAFTYIMDNYRRNAVTDQQYCREQEEMAHLAHTCATYLQSNRKYQQLHAEYHGRGERTVKETADLVGFKLPHDPR
ncbi:protein FMC1 homolog [Penaeus japonicus]|uniref:protein FMC1 homolog n=1 Tax=Penaeus japonicus TaxID=27405 RepID=UPI001C70BBAC|nr:protein FMC1 homolog [Penaeus japonicus]